MARVVGHRVMASGTLQRVAGRKDPREHWGSWQWSEGTGGRGKSLPHSWGHSWEWHRLVRVCESASTLGVLPPTQGHRGSQEQAHGTAQTVRGAEGCRERPGKLKEQHPALST